MNDASPQTQPPSKAATDDNDDNIPDLDLTQITEGETERGIPLAKFIDDIDGFVNSFTPPAPAELLIGAYTNLENRYRTFEAQLTQKRECFIPKRSTL